MQAGEVAYPKRPLRALCVVLVLSACTSTAYRAKFLNSPARAPGAAQAMGTPADSPFVKCHLANGGLYVLERWKLGATEIEGSGVLYAADRSIQRTGSFRVRFEDIVVVETNRPEEFTRVNVAVMGVVSAVSLAVTAFCVAEPKTCFGSCPTFYAFDGERRVLQAEGFSASIARVLEQRDLDALPSARPVAGELELLVTNEALETHAIRGVALLAAPRAAGARVFRSGERYFSAAQPQAPTLCRAERGDCKAELERADELEYLSPADDRDLSAREIVELEFVAPPGPLGLVIAGRNSLLNTFLFYEALGYMGRRAGELMAELERGGTAVDAVKSIGRALGDVEVSVLGRDGAWHRAGEFSEVGPIARETQLVPLELELSRPKLRVKLELARGNWKLDWVALARLGPPVTPVRLTPVSLRVGGRPDSERLDRLNDPGRYLYTHPGDSFELVFKLPPGDHELFLESTGYYYEWMRASWMKNESRQHLAELLLRPEAALKRLAPEYKRVEADFERLFWESRVELSPADRSKP